VEQLLDCQEALAIQRIADSVQRFGENVCVAADVRGKIRRHPLTAVGLAALSGFIGGPLILRNVQGWAASASTLAKSTSLRPPNLPDLVLASLRVARARR
jgi:hypothetical protein